MKIVYLNYIKQLNQVLELLDIACTLDLNRNLNREIKIWKLFKYRNYLFYST